MRKWSDIENTLKTLQNLGFLSLDVLEQMKIQSAGIAQNLKKYLNRSIQIMES
jgi:hypothetical protein